MDSKCKYWMLLLTLLCVISLGFSLFRVFPCEVGNETFLGIVLSAVGIIVTLVMGYQIFSVVEFRGELQKQKEENIKLAHDNAKLQQMIRNQMGALDKQKGRIEEGLNMCFSYINYFSGQDVCTAFGAFVPMLDALYYSLDSDEDGIGNEKTSDEDALPVLADVQDFGRYAADGIGQKNRRKGQEQVRRDAEQRIMGEVLFQLAEHV
mgnify:CR=1 FL=1